MKMSLWVKICHLKKMLQQLRHRLRHRMTQLEYRLTQPEYRLRQSYQTRKTLMIL